MKKIIEGKLEIRNMYIKVIIIIIIIDYYYYYQEEKGVSNIFDPFV